MKMAAIRIDSYKGLSTAVKCTLHSSRIATAETASQ